MTTTPTPSNKRQAISLAYQRLSDWAKVSGYIPEGTSLYFEIEGLIDDAITLGRQSAFAEMGTAIPDDDLLEEWGTGE